MWIPQDEDLENAVCNNEGKQTYFLQYTVKRRISYSQFESSLFKRIQFEKKFLNEICRIRIKF